MITKWHFSIFFNKNISRWPFDDTFFLLKTFFSDFFSRVDRYFGRVKLRKKTGKNWMSASQTRAVRVP